MGVPIKAPHKIYGIEILNEGTGASFDDVTSAMESKQRALEIGLGCSNLNQPLVTLLHDPFPFPIRIDVCGSVPKDAILVMGDGYCTYVENIGPPARPPNDELRR